MKTAEGGIDCLEPCSGPNFALFELHEMLHETAVMAQVVGWRLYY